MDAESSGGVREVGIREALLRAHELGEIQCESPLATVAVLRLLLAVLYRACGPEGIEDWLTLWDAKTLPAEQITKYLNAQDGFDLFGPKPFLQVGGMTMKEAAPLAALATEEATGNNPTLFDHSSDDVPGACPPARAARMLLAAQAFALGFGKAAEAVLDGRTFPRPYLADAICLRGVTLWLSGRNLRETLLLNLVPGERKKDDLPAWELADPTERLDRVGGDGKRQSVRAKGTADRYVWQSRMVRLLPEADGTVRRAYFTQGREADKSPGDPMKVYVSDEKVGLYALNLNAEKAAWRDLHSFLSLGRKASFTILAFTARLVEQEGVLKRDSLARLNVVGLATDPGKAGKFLLWRHDRMSLPAVFLADETLMDHLELGLKDAEDVAREARSRMYVVAQRFLPPEGNPDPKDVASLTDVLNPQQAFWARLEAHFPRFVNDLPKGASAALAAWHENVEQEAARALRESCRQLGESPRAMKATARVGFSFVADRRKLQALIEAAKQKKRKGDKKT